ncbi:MAG: nonstructural protein [Arizlama microvirus]|nr:MAG: nonstructural protein [Arizlama microvirus]
MSKLIVCAVFDSAVQAYSRPFYVPALGAAVRSFTDETNRSAADNPLFQHPADFDLRVLATFDEESGVFGEPEGGAGRVLARGSDVKRGE